MHIITNECTSIKTKKISVSASCSKDDIFTTFYFEKKRKLPNWWLKFVFSFQWLPILPALYYIHTHIYPVPYMTVYVDGKWGGVLSEFFFYKYRLPPAVVLVKNPWRHFCLFEEMAKSNPQKLFRRFKTHREERNKHIIGSFHLHHQQGKPYPTF